MCIVRNEWGEMYFLIHPSSRQCTDSIHTCLVITYQTGYWLKAAQGKNNSAFIKDTLFSPGHTVALAAGPHPLPSFLLQLLKAQVTVSALGSVTPEKTRTT